MDFSSQARIVNERQHNLRREAAEARSLKTSRVVDGTGAQHDRFSGIKRLVATFGAHGRQAHAATRDALQAQVAPSTTLRTAERPGR